MILKKLSIIIPVYNEEKTIEEIIRRVKKADIHLEKEIIVVDDGSTDSSLSILKRIKGIKLILCKKNSGKGAAVRTGFGHAKGDVVIIQDADLEYNPEDIPLLIKPILDGNSKAVYGTRFFKKNNKKWKIPSHYLGNRFLSFITSIFYGCWLTDMETGYKAFHKKVMDDIKKLNFKSRGFEFEPEITVMVIKLGYSIKEVPIRFNPRGFEEGKKITWRDGFKALSYLIYYRFKGLSKK